MTSPIHFNHIVTYHNNSFFLVVFFCFLVKTLQISLDFADDNGFYIDIYRCCSFCPQLESFNLDDALIVFLLMDDEVLIQLRFPLCYLLPSSAK